MSATEVVLAHRLLPAILVLFTSGDFVFMHFPSLPRELLIISFLSCVS